MVDLTEFLGEDALRASIKRKRDKVRAKLNDMAEKHRAKIGPLCDQLEKYDALLQVIDEHDGAVGEAENVKPDESAD